jgi:uncharacterized membrane protein (UPF0182 family)
MRNSVKAVVDAYDGTTTFYVFDPQDSIISAYRRIFPSLFKDALAMPAALRKHLRYPELLLKLQAAVYGLYHMTDPQVFTTVRIFGPSLPKSAWTNPVSRRHRRWSQTLCS